MKSLQTEAGRLDSQDEFEALGLCRDTIRLHQSRIINRSRTKSDGVFHVVVPCSLANGRIVDIDRCQLDAGRLTGYIGFVPAAGAASRYSSPLVTLRRYIAEKSSQRFDLATKLLNAPLPEDLIQVVSDVVADRSLTLRQLRALDEIASRPKALFPCDGQETFLSMKDKEHAAIAGVDGQVFITSESYQNTIRSSFGGDAVFLAQDASLCTIRFYPDGSPFRDKRQTLVRVPAGHGTLVAKFAEVRRHFPKADSVLIRNIDNVGGVSQEFVGKTEQFLRLHQGLKKHVEAIRRELAAGRTDQAREHASGIYRLLGRSWDPQDSGRALEKCLVEVFDTPQNLLDDQRLLDLYERPVNLVGVTPNSGKDVGGLPVLAEIHGLPVKMILEQPHIAAEDREVVNDPSRATHFNPVFIAAELPQRPMTVDKSPFWILSRKNWRGEELVHHETVLSEVVGNSLEANVVMVELPDYCFKPHKTLF